MEARSVVSRFLICQGSRHCTKGCQGREDRNKTSTECAQSLRGIAARWCSTKKRGEWRKEEKVEKEVVKKKNKKKELMFNWKRTKINYHYLLANFDFSIHILLCWTYHFSKIGGRLLQILNSRLRHFYDIIHSSMGRDEWSTDSQ